ASRPLDPFLGSTLSLAVQIPTRLAAARAPRPPLSMLFGDFDVAAGEEKASRAPW
ncbi:MAG: hypothetical protein Q9210_006991, partial [Variospora velana]